MRVAAIIWATTILGLQVYLFRRIRDDLVKNHMEGPKGFRAMLADMANAGLCTIVEDEIRFWTGSKIYLCHCKDAKDIYKYQGAEIHVLLIDELTHFEEPMYRFLRNRVRMVGITLPASYVGQFPRILCGANPGNIGHQFVKASFIDRGEAMSIIQQPVNEGGMLRQYIPARLDDNPSMEKDDPGYEARLSGLGSEALVRAMRDGDWSVVDGAFFDNWSISRHVVRPFAVPPEWLRFRSMDWGYAKPFSIGWWAVASDDTLLDDGHFVPRGAIIRYREWYGCEPGKPDTGLRMDADKVAAGILARERDEKIAYGVIDPATHQHTSGPSIAETMLRCGVTFRRADNTRVGPVGAVSGWNAVRSRLTGVDSPMLFVFSTCLDFIRTVPVLQHDPDRPEDLNTDMEDHIADEVRYACLSRPWIPKELEPPKPKDLIYQVDHTGKVVGNMGVRDRVMQLEKKRKQRERGY